MRFLPVLFFIFCQIAAYGGGTKVISREQATMAAAYLNQEKEIVLHCQECTEPFTRKVIVDDAEVVKNNGRYSIRLHGHTKENEVVNELIDLKNVYVRQGRYGRSLGQILNLECNGCNGKLYWRTLEPAETEGPGRSGVSKMVDQLMSDLTTDMPEGTFARLDTVTYEIDRTSCTFDSAGHTLRFVLFTSIRSKIVYNVAMKENLRFSITELDSTTMLQIVHGKKGKKKQQSFWYVHFNSREMIENSGNVEMVYIPLKPGLERKKTLRTLRKLSRRQ